MDEEQFKRLYERYVSDLYHFVFQYLKSEELSKEIVQDTFIRLWLHRDNLNPERSVRPYLFTISYHMLIKELRWQVRNPLIRDYLDFVKDISVEDQSKYDYDTYLHAFNRARNHLSARQKDILELSMVQSLSVKEIASRLGIGEQVVRNQISLSKKKIREFLKKYML